MYLDVFFVVVRNMYNSLKFSKMFSCSNSNIKSHQWIFFSIVTAYAEVFKDNLQCIENHFNKILGYDFKRK